MVKSWFAGTSSSINSEIIAPFSNAEQVIYKYNQAIEHNSLTQQGWQRLIAQCDDGLAAYLTNIKGSTASMSAYTVSLQGNITGYTKITAAMKQYNTLGAVSKKEQQNFATAVGLTNTKLGSYLTGLNGAKASLAGYGVSLVASTVKTVGLTIATTALNAALTMGISAIVTGLITAFSAWISTSKKVTEAAQEAKDKISSITDSLKTNAETVENTKKRYAELAQEVENLGKINQSRGSLSTEKYEEFLDLSNQLANVFPTLTKGYDDNGNAILDLSGNVNTIVSSLDDLLKKEKELANQKMLEEYPDMFRGYIKDLSKAKQEAKNAKVEFDKITNAYQQLSNGGATQAFDLHGNGSFENSEGEQVKITLSEYEQALKDLGVKYKKTNIMVKNQYGGNTLSGYLIDAVGDIDTAFTSKLETARKNLQYAEQQLESEKSSIDSYLNTWLQSEFIYSKMNDTDLQSVVQDMVMNFDFSNLPDSIDKNNWEAVSEYLRRNILFAINDAQNDPKISKALSQIFTNENLTPEEKSNYLKQIIDYFGEDNAISIALQPQIEDNDALKKSYENTLNRFKTDTQKISKDLETAQQNLEDEYSKISDWGLGDYVDQIKNGTIQSVFGNVDMDKRTIITWSNELKQTYADALASWDYDPEVGSIDTVFGGSERFGEDLNGKGWEVAFTPILPDGTFLSKDTVEEYINSILAQAYADDGKVTEDELKAIDAQGRQIGNTFVQGIFAGIDDSQNYENNGNWAEVIGRLMHFAGKFGAVQIAKDQKSELEKQFGKDGSQIIKNFFDTEGINTQEEIDAFNEVTKGINDADAAIQKWIEHKQDNDSLTLSMSDYLNQSELADTKKKLLDLAKSGEITEETLTSTEEYAKILSTLGISAEDAKTQILNMLGATDKLSAANAGMDKLTNAYKEFKDKGFVLAETLSALPTVFKNLDGYNAFEKIVGDPTSGAEKIQQAFNDIATEYITTQATLAGLSEENMHRYIANLTDMGVTNAEEVVRNYLSTYSESEKLVVDLTKKAYDAYLKYLNSKSSSDLEYFNGLVSNNSELAKALGETYKSDYNNWIKLLQQKANAYSSFVSAIKGGQVSIGSATAAMSDQGIAKKQAEEIVKNASMYGTKNGKPTSPFDYALGKNSNSNAKYTQSQVDKAKEYLASIEKYDELQKKLSIDLSTINTDFGSSFSFSGSKDGSSSEKDSKKTFDWIEKALTRIKEAYDRLNKVVSATYRSWSTRNNALAQEIVNVRDQIALNQKAYEGYMAQANSVGLSDYYKTLVQNGAISIEDITDEDLQEQIENYQTWYVTMPLHVVMRDDNSI